MTNQTVNPAMPGDSSEPKHVRVPLTQLPNAKEGDCFTVAKIDTASGMAILTPEGETPEVDDEKSLDADKPEVSTDDDSEEESTKPEMDTKTLLGPMDGLKNYLVQKSMDAPKNSGR